MANGSNTIEIELLGVDNFTPVINDAKVVAERNTNVMFNFAKSTGLVVRRLSQAQLALSAFGAVLANAAIQSSIKFENSQIELEKVLTDGAISMGEYSKAAIDMSEIYGVSSASILEGIATFTQAGFKSADVIGLQKNALDLVIAGNIDMGSSTELLTSILKGYRAELSEAPRFIEAMNNVSNHYATDLEQLARGMAKLAPITNTMGFSFEEATGLLTPVIEVFRSGTEAANALKTGLLRLIDDSKPVQEALASIGVQQKDTTGQLKSGRDILYEVGEAFTHVNENQKLFLTKELVGIQQSARMVEVFNQLGSVQKITSAAMLETGSALHEVDVRLGSTSVSTLRLGETMTNLSAEIGSHLTRSLRTSAGGLSEFLTTIRETADKGGFNQIFDAINDGANLFNEGLMTLAKNFPEAMRMVDLSGVANEMGRIGEEIRKVLVNDLQLDTAEGLAETIQAIVNIFTRLSEAVRASIPTIGAFFAVIRDVFAFIDADVGDNGGIISFFVMLSKEIVLLTLQTEALAYAVKSIIPDITNGIIAFAISLFFPYIAGIAAVVASLLYGYNKLADANEQLNREAEGIAANQKSIEERAKSLTASFKQLSDETGVVITSMLDLIAAEDSGILVFDKLIGKYTTVTKVIVDTETARNEANQTVLKEGELQEILAFSLHNTVDEHKTLSRELRHASEAGKKYNELIVNGTLVAFELWDEVGKKTRITTNEITGEVITLTAEQLKMTEQMEKAIKDGNAYHKTMELGVIKSLHVWETKQIDVNKTLKNAKDDLDKLTDREIEAIKQTSQLTKTLVSLASNERIKNMEFRANINIAEIQADAQIAIAAFNSVASVVKSTSDAVAKIYNAGRDENDAFGFEFSNQLAKANERADKALTNATKLTNAQVKQMEAKTRAIIRGDANIKIIGEGLTPILQELLRTLMEEIQIQANSEGLELLL